MKVFGFLPRAKRSFRAFALGLFLLFRIPRMALLEARRADLLTSNQ